jgi:hypothetical protein
MNTARDHEERVKRAREVRIEDEIRRRGIKLKKIAKHELAGACPRCGGTDRFSVNTAKQVFNCRGCGKGGDIIDFVMLVDGGEFNDALETLAPGASKERKKRSARGPNGKNHAGANGASAQKNDDIKRDTEPAAIYDYVDAGGKLQFQVLRYLFHKVSDGSRALDANGKPKKTFVQRRPDPDFPEVWVWGLNAGDYLRRGPGSDWFVYTDEKWGKLSATRERKTIAAGVEPLPYRLPEVLEALAGEQRIFIVEGEAKVDCLGRWNVTATCNAAGAGKWTAEHAKHLRDADVVIMPDNDDAGRKHAEAVAQSLKGIAARIRVVELPDLAAKGDVVDWIEAGHTREELDALVDKAPSAGAIPEWPDLGKGDVPVTTSRANARAAIQALGIECRYDIFHDKFLVGGNVIGQWAGEMSDAACLMIRETIHKTFGFDPGKQCILDAVGQLSLRNQFDPICQYLDALKWDGVERLDTWPIKYLGAEDTKLNRAIGRLALIAGVRRVRQPGCKFDQIVVLESPEGFGKSAAIETLAGTENFSDQTILGVNDKEQQELLRGVWFYEIADLAGMKRADVEHVKAFASRTHDRARPAYGTCRVDLPRRCILWGSTNNQTYLQSQTGNRRFWPMRTGKINIEALRRDRDQLWAEAAALEAAGASLKLPEELWGLAGIEQEARRDADPWDDILVNAQGTISDVFGDGSVQEERISTVELLNVHLKIPPDRITDQSAKRLSFCMARLGWAKASNPVRIGGKLQRGYFRKPPPPAPDDLA